jgi:glycosyltransferase involved in cell wall biosynthesis
MPYQSGNNLPTVPRVSVILTVYKRTEFLSNALNSVLAQSYANCEIIIADDSGSGASREIVAAFGQPERVKYLANAATMGVAASLVQAVGQARGEFVTILNDDDVWEKDFLAELVAPLEADPQRVLAFCDHWLMDEGGQIDGALSETWSANFERSHLPEGVVRGAADFCVIKHGIPIAVASVFRKDAFDWSLVSSDVTGAYDYWISCLLAATGRPIYYVPKRLARWRMHEGMETRRRSHDKGENLVYIFSVMCERGWFPELDAALKAELAEALFVVGRDKLHFHRVQEARSHFWRCFVLCFRPGALAGVAVTFLPGFIRKTLREFLSILRKCRGLRRGRQGQNSFANIRTMR